VKTETITVKACEVQVGDAIGAFIVNHVLYVDSKGFCKWMMDLQDKYKAYMEFPRDHLITISRPVADPCPRGRMTRTRTSGFGVTCIDGKQFSEFSADSLGEIHRRMTALWNEAEREPYRTTEEIERGHDRSNLK
jgi:hypothetical protein